MAIAQVNGVTVAQSDATVVVEGNHYFPSESVNWEYFNEVDKTTVCSWKGEANYFSVEVDGTKLEEVAWTYRNPSDKAANIKDFVAFYPQVQVDA